MSPSQIRLGLVVLTDPWLFVEFNLTDPFARLRLTIALDIPRRVSRIHLWVALLISILTASPMIYYETSIGWGVFALSGPLFLHVAWEQFVKKRVYGWRLTVDSHDDWCLNIGTGEPILVDLQHGVQNLFGCYLTLKTVDRMLRSDRVVPQFYRVMVWRCSLDQQDFRLFSIIAYSQMQQDSPSMSLGDKV